MKTFILPAMAVVIQLFCNDGIQAQTKNNMIQEETRNFYLQKSKNQRNTGYILSVVGTAMILGGGISFNNNWEKEGAYTATDISGFIILGGIVADLVSIPFFISASKNKRKAASISLCFQSICFQQYNTSSLNTNPTITLRIELSR